MSVRSPGSLVSEETPSVHFSRRAVGCRDRFAGIGGTALGHVRAKVGIYSCKNDGAMARVGRRAGSLALVRWSELVGL